jgi:hypothetical protein
MRTLIYGTAALAWACAAACAQPACNTNAVRGNWSMSASGWGIPLGAANAAAAPIVGIGAFSIDFAGKLTGSGTIIWAAGLPNVGIAAGDVLDFDMEGSVDVGPDCTGVWRYSVRLRGVPGMPPVPGYVERIVVIPQRDEIVFQSVKSPLSKPMWTGTAKRISQVPSAISWQVLQ